VFVPGKPFQPSLMFVGVAWAYLSEAPFRCSTLLASPTNVRLGWKGLSGTNTLAYYVKSFMVQTPAYRGSSEKVNVTIF
jgi:hypothetical protein